MGTWTNFPAALQGMLQQNFLERELEEGLDSILAYRREALQEVINARIGETLTRSKKGRVAPSTTPLTPSLVTGLDDGLTAVTFAMEQYSFTLQEWGGTVDVDLLQDLAGIADQLVANSRNNGVVAAQTLERIARQRLFAAYLGGNSIVRTDLGAGGTTTAHVDDVRGFQNVLVNGQLVAVSASNTLSVTEVATSTGGVNQTLTVTAVAVDSTNNSCAPDGVSGTLTFSTATTPVNLDALVATNAPKIFRANGRQTSQLLGGQDMLTLGLIEDAVASLRDNAIPPMDDRTYHLLCDNTSMRQLYADQDWKLYFAGREATPEFRDGDIVRLLGVTFIPTTEAYVQNKQIQWNGTANTTAGTVVRVRRPILLGSEVFIEGIFEGLRMWLSRPGVNPIGEVMIINNVAQIVRPPLDRLQRTISMSWHWIGDFAVPSDQTATTSIIPTASNAYFRRGAVLEHAG